MNNITPELHLFIIWENGLYQKEKITTDIIKNFKLLNIYNTQWDQDNYINNLTRFYGENLPSGSEKEIECGNGRFSLLVVLDKKPFYCERLTSKGPKIVNVNMFDSKDRYRSWTGGGHKIHATNDIDETRHDLFLLLGITYDDYIASVKTEESVEFVEKNINMNLAGCIQWSSLEELFSLLNQTIDYVVLRNFEGMPESYYQEDHGDIDILVNCSPEHAAKLMNAKPVYSKKYRVHYKANINNETVRFDIRHVGDGYYDKNWEKQILEKRVNFNGFYIPDPENHKYSLLYHALIHRSFVSDDYKEKLASFGLSSESLHVDLQNFMRKKRFKYSEPRDLSVYFNTTAANSSVSLKRKFSSIKYKTISILGDYLNPLLKAKLKRFLKIKSYLLPTIVSKIRHTINKLLIIR